MLTLIPQPFAPEYPNPDPNPSLARHGLGPWRQQPQHQARRGQAARRRAALLGLAPPVHAGLPPPRGGLPRLLGPAEELPQVVSTTPSPPPPSPLHLRPLTLSSFTLAPFILAPSLAPSPAAVDPHLCSNSTSAGTRRPSSRALTRPRKRTRRPPPPSSPTSARSTTGGPRARRPAAALPDRRSSLRPKRQRDRARGRARDQKRPRSAAWLRQGDRGQRPG
eukprot:scaffold143264_cov93-Phaeocystis_antarctica.AAC.1